MDFKKMLLSMQNCKIKEVRSYKRDGEDSETGDFIRYCVNEKGDRFYKTSIDNSENPSNRRDGVSIFFNDKKETSLYIAQHKGDTRISIVSNGIEKINTSLYEEDVLENSQFGKFGYFENLVNKSYFRVIICDEVLSPNNKEEEYMYITTESDIVLTFEFDKKEEEQHV